MESVVLQPPPSVCGEFISETVLCCAGDVASPGLLDSPLLCALEADANRPIRLLSCLCLHFRVQSVGNSIRTQVPLVAVTLDSLCLSCERCPPAHLLFHLSTSSPHTWPLPDSGFCLGPPALLFPRHQKRCQPVERSLSSLWKSFVGAGEHTQLKKLTWKNSTKEMEMNGDKITAHRVAGK